MKRLGIIAMLCLLIGVVSAQTAWNETAFKNTAASGSSQVFRNINQSSHWLFYCAGSGVTGGTIEIDGSADKTNWITISSIGALQPNQCNIIQGGGYYPYVTAQIKNFTGAVPGVNATYSASVGPISLPANTGYAVTTSPVTMVPASKNTIPALKSTANQISNVANVVLYGATVSNPNTGTVYVAFAGNSTPFVGGGANVFMIPVAAGQTVAAFPPAEGIGFSNGTGLWVGCSTSPTSASDPASNCVVSVLFKNSATGAVPN